MLIIYEAGICEDFLNMMCPRADTTACCYFMLSELDIVKKSNSLLVHYVNSIDQFSLNSSISERTRCQYGNSSVGWR